MMFATVDRKDMKRAVTVSIPFRRSTIGVREKCNPNPDQFMDICEGVVYFGTGSRRRSSRCSRKGYREVGGRKYCFLHAERAKSEIAIRALRNISAYVGELTDEEAEVGVAGELTGEALGALEQLNEEW
jgi:hypothetical protein